MAFMRRDVNILLLVLVLVCAFLFTGFSVYYQTSFKNVSLEYQNKLDQLGKVTEELTTQREKLNETYSQRVKAETDRQALDVRYQDVNDENEGLKQDKSNLISDLSSSKKQLSEKTAELDATKRLLETTQNELLSTRVARDKYKRDWEDVCGDYTALNNGDEHNNC